MIEFKKYRKKQIAELREITTQEENSGATKLLTMGISVSQEDINNGSPKRGDMIARNPKNHQDQWLVAEQYFKDNFELCEATSCKHNFKLGDEVYHSVDKVPFVVVGIRNTTIEIQGDWSGGTHNVNQKSWVNYTEIKSRKS